MSLYDASVPCWRFIDGRGTNPDGRYSFVVVPGDYKISFFPPPGRNLAGEWWNDKASFETADTLSGSSDHLDLDAPS